METWETMEEKVQGMRKRKMFKSREGLYLKPFVASLILIYTCVYTYKLYSKKGKCEYGNYRRFLVKDFCFLHEIKFLCITVKFYQFMFIKSDSSE